MKDEHVKDACGKSPSRKKGRLAKAAYDADFKHAAC